MRKFIVAVFLILTLSAKFIFGSHIAALTLSYAISGGPNTYLLTLKLYRDCFGTPLANSQRICFSSNSCGTNDTILLSLTTSSILPPCIFGPSLPYCYEEFIYQGTVILPYSCPDWIFSYSSPFTYGPLQSFDVYNPSGAFYVEATLDNFNFSNNNSAFQTHEPCFRFCIFNPVLTDVTASDLDNDSLDYSFQSFLLDTLQSCPSSPFPKSYYPPFSPTNFIQSSTPIILNNVTGSLSFNANQLMIGHASFLIKEFRNGILIGSTMMQQMVYTSATGCTINIPQNSYSEKANTVFPNPTSGILCIKDFSEDIIINSIEIYNTLCEKVKSFTATKTIFIGDLPKGLYLVQIRSDEEIIYSEKIILE